MLFGMLAISGIFPFAGFFSKDAIILGALLSGHYTIFAILLFTAGLTAYYCFRLFFLVFYSQNPAPKQHKVPFSMLGVNYIRDAVVIAFVVNETISIVENAGLMGVPIPAAITKAIEMLRDKSDQNTSSAG